MFLTEIFYTVQGEGKFVGRPSVFVRVGTCPLRCHFCDTPYSSWKPEGREYAIGEIVDTVNKFNCNSIVLTGGEPASSPEVVELCDAFPRYYHITLETAGIIFKPFKISFASISPKLKTSTPVGKPEEAKHEKARYQPEVLEKFLHTFDCQFKYVISSKDDFEEIEKINKEVNIPDNRVWLMSEGRTREELLEKDPWVIEEAKKRNWNWTPRAHVMVYGMKRGV